MNLHAMRSVVAGCPGDHANQTEKLLCFQCAIKNSGKQNDDQLQTRLTAFFSKLASERRLDVALLTFGGISGMLERDEFTYQTTKRTSLEFSRLLHKSGLYACAGTIMDVLLNMDPNSGGEEMCSIYYICSIVGEVFSLHHIEFYTKELFMQVVSEEFYEEKWKKHEGANHVYQSMIDAGLVTKFVRLLGGERGVYEQIRSAWALRMMASSRLILDVMYSEDAATPAFETYITFGRRVQNFRESDFKPYELLLACAPVGNRPVLSILEATPRNVLPLMRDRKTSVLENTMEIIAHIALLPQGTRFLLIDRPQIIEFTIAYSKMPFSCEDDEDPLISIGWLWTNLLRGSPAKVKTALDRLMAPPFNFLDHFELSILPTTVGFVTRIYLFALRCFVVACNNEGMLKDVMSHHRLVDMVVEMACAYHEFYLIHAAAIVQTLIVSPETRDEMVHRYKDRLFSLLVTIRNSQIPEDIKSSICKALMNALQLNRELTKTFSLRNVQEDNNQGNQMFREKKYVESLRYYATGLRELEFAPIVKDMKVNLRNNSAQCCLNMNEYFQAFYHTYEVIFNGSDASLYKGLYRRAVALEGMGPEFLPAATQIWSRLCFEQPNDRSFRAKFSQSVKQLQEVSPELLSFNVIKF